MKIVIRRGACAWGEVVGRDEDDARHEVFEHDACARIRARYPDAEVIITIDRRVSGGPTRISIDGDPCDPRERNISECLGSAWQAACEAHV